MNWLDILNFLSEKTRLENVGKFNWTDPVVVRNVATGESMDITRIFEEYDARDGDFVLGVRPQESEVI